MKIYTKTGDKGKTTLLAGRRVSKNDVRVEAYGTIDELNAALGLARALGVDDETDALLDAVQHTLFNLGSDMATPLDRAPDWLVRVTDDAVQALEHQIDAMDAELAQLRQFILPGGAPGGAALHLARTVCRRAERATVALMEAEPINEICLRYLNRLSDWLFMAARLANARAGCPEIPWRSMRE